ncbi:hypothetical protein IQ06DRAFT_90754 [Phaeosphaeriaceae sp. SRC1lsM3a]|nr:hypothetical protein IQ06DRAFT_90754 [Stagonospora sp. SRC1lsM3a]
MRVRWILALYHITGWRTVFLVAWLAWIDSGTASRAFRAFEWHLGPLFISCCIQSLRAIPSLVLVTSIALPIVSLHLDMILPCCVSAPK